MSKLVRLDDLIWLADTTTDAADGVLQRDLGNSGLHQLPYKLDRLIRQCLATWNTFVPVQTARTEIGTGRMKDGQVPSALNSDCIKHITLDMVGTAIHCREKIVAPCFVPSRSKRLSYYT
jgi:hypothetical protein